MSTANYKNQSPAKLDNEQIAELREIFGSFDRNKDGSLTPLELRSLLRSLGLQASHDQVDALMQKADRNNNGMVEFSEFLVLVEPDLLEQQQQRQGGANMCPYSEEMLKNMFDMFDRDGNGFISAAELAHSMAKLGHALSAEELIGMIREADTDGDGQIDFQEFVTAITSAAFCNRFT